MWNILLSHLRNRRRDIIDKDSLERNLTEVWNEFPFDIIHEPSARRLSRLQICVEHSGQRFEHLFSLCA